MKRRCTLLFVLALTLFTGLAKADPVDPSVILNDPPSLALSRSCPANTICLSLPLVVLQLNNGIFPQTNFEYIGRPTSTFFVVLDDVLPGEPFTCSSNFLSCSLLSTNTCPPHSLFCQIISNIDIKDFDDDTVAFAFTVRPGKPLLTRGTSFTTAVSVPEPSLMCQLLLGVLPLLFLGRKYWVTPEAD